jgi:hypothetical protein
MVAGVGWALTLNTNYAAMQSGLPSWVRARGLSLYALLLQGSMAIGSLIWGAVAELIGVSSSLVVAASLLLASSLLLRWRYRLEEAGAAQVTPVPPWIAFSVAGELDPEGGPVAVEIEYRIDPLQHRAFIDASREVGRVRKRDGVFFWRIYRDIETPGCYRERFIIESWAEYQRILSRATLAGRESERRLHGFHLGPGPLRVTHSIAER